MATVVALPVAMVADLGLGPPLRGAASLGPGPPECLLSRSLADREDEYVRDGPHAFAYVCQRLR